MALGTASVEGVADEAVQHPIEKSIAAMLERTTNVPIRMSSSLQFVMVHSEQQIRA
jgi:hypothetical protein